MTQLHAAIGPVVLVLAVVLGAAAAVLASRGSSPQWVEWVRRAVLGIVVVGAAVGLALAVRGSSPGEAIHWVYGVGIIVVLMVPGTLRADMPPGRRSGALAVGALLAAVLAWRLGASG